MGQRYIKALGMQAKSDNMFLVRSSIDSIAKQVGQSTSLLHLEKSRVASAEDLQSAQAN